MMATLISIDVIAGDDDAMKRYSGATAGYFPASGSIQFGHPSAIAIQDCAGMIFRAVPLPAGITINSATLTLRRSLGNYSTTECHAKIRAYAADDYAGDFSTEAEWDAIFPGSLTTAEVAWNPGSWTNGADHTTPDISTVVQELVDRPGWVSGNDMVYFVDDFDNNSDEGHFRIWRAFESGGGSGETLNVSYTVDRGQIMHIQSG